MRARQGRRAQEALAVGRSYLGVVLGEAAFLTVVSAGPYGAVARWRGHGLVLVPDEAPMIPAVALSGNRVRVERVLPTLDHAIV